MMNGTTSATSALNSFVTNVQEEGFTVYGAHFRVGSERASHRWRSDDRENLYSVSKGVSAIATGIAVDEGLITLETTVGEALIDMPLGAGVDKVTLRHLLTMTSGIDFLWFGHEPVPWPDLAAEMLSRPTTGPKFQYSDVSTYVAMRMLGARVGDVRDWLMPRLFDPLQIDNPQWHRCPLGWIVAGTGHPEHGGSNREAMGDIVGRWFPIVHTAVAEFAVGLAEAAGSTTVTAAVERSSAELTNQLEKLGVHVRAVQEAAR